MGQKNVRRGEHEKAGIKSRGQDERNLPTIRGVVKREGKGHREGPRGGIRTCGISSTKTCPEAKMAA